MKLMQPQFDGEISLERAIKNRRTRRSFTSRSLTQVQLSQLLWAAYGITDGRGFMRAVPSGGALYPMDVYALLGSGGVRDIEEGLYHYEPGTHAVTPMVRGDLRKELARASLSQMWMAEAPLNLVISAEYGRITGRYGKRGIRYALMEAGHIAQNIFLQAEALGLGAGIVGAFDDERVTETLRLPKNHEPLLIMPVGYTG
ncbi:MAG: SagB/ThcOx family dehydrogenase [Thermodesulfobacteriota bacterium]